MGYAVTHELDGSTEVDVQIYIVRRNLNSKSTLDFLVHSFMGYSKRNSNTAYFTISTRWKWKMHFECSRMVSWLTFTPHSNDVVFIN